MEILNKKISEHFKRNLDADSFIYIGDIYTDENTNLPMEEKQDEIFNCMEISVQLIRPQTTNEKILEEVYDICCYTKKDIYVCVLAMLLADGIRFEFLISFFEYLMLYTIIYNVIILYITNYAFLITNGRAPPV